MKEISVSAFDMSEITLAWRFLTEELGLPKEKLRPSVYEVLVPFLSCLFLLYLFFSFYCYCPIQLPSNVGIERRRSGGDLVASGEYSRVFCLTYGREGPSLPPTRCIAFYAITTGRTISGVWAMDLVRAVPAAKHPISLFLSVPSILVVHE